MRKKNIEPMVKVGRKCRACGIDFTLSHPNDPRLYCDKCMDALKEIILARRRENDNKS